MTCRAVVGGLSPVISRDGAALADTVEQHLAQDGRGSFWSTEGDKVSPPSLTCAGGPWVWADRFPWFKTNKSFAVSMGLGNVTAQDTAISTKERLHHLEVWFKMRQVTAYHTLSDLLSFNVGDVAPNGGCRYVFDYVPNLSVQHDDMQLFSHFTHFMALYSILSNGQMKKLGDMPGMSMLDQHHAMLDRHISCYLAPVGTNRFYRGAVPLCKNGMYYTVEVLCSVPLECVMKAKKASEPVCVV